MLEPLADLTKPVRCDSRGSFHNGNIRDHELNQFAPHFRHCQCCDSIAFENNLKGKVVTCCEPSLALARLSEAPVNRVW